MTLKELRLSMSWTAEQAAEKLGVSRQQLFQWENGNPTVKTLNKICKVYNCDYSVDHGFVGKFEAALHSMEEIKEMLEEGEEFAIKVAGSMIEKKHAAALFRLLRSLDLEYYPLNAGMTGMLNKKLAFYREQHGLKG